MESQEQLKYNLSILVELDLYRKITLIRESDLEDKENKILKAIQDFENNLQDKYKSIQNFHKFIIEKIKKIDKNILDLQKQRAER